MRSKRIPTGQLFGTRPLNQIVPQHAFPEISPKLQQVLQQIVTDLVARLGCVGAMVTTLERGNALPVRAYSMRFAPNLLERLEKQAGVSLIGPQACVYLDDDSYKDNISYRAVGGQNGKPEKFIISERLADLFYPIVSRGFAELAQKMTGIRQLIALPFFIEGQVVGNLFAATRDAFSQRDIDFLTAFGQQAANAIQTQRHLDETQALERVILELQSHLSNETAILQTTVDAVVEKLGYAGAMVSTLEADNTMPLRAMTFDISPEIIRGVEQKTSTSLTNYQLVAAVDDPRFRENLGYRAIMRDGIDYRDRFLESDSLYDLFRPVISRPIADEVQSTFGVKRVIAVPFFIENEPVGNMYVMTRKNSFSEHDKAILAAFAQQAAVGIRNSRLYRRAEEQRQIAQTLARMAFSASAYVHTLRNHVGAIGNYLMLTQDVASMSVERQAQVADIRETIVELVGQTADILDNLHEPWRQGTEAPTDLNLCIYRAINKLFPNLQVESGVTTIDTQVGTHIYLNLDDDLPTISTSPEMLTEAVSILLNNSAQAVTDIPRPGRIWFTTRTDVDGDIEFAIQDNGTGIRNQDLDDIFEIGWSTRDDGMGFGLFWMKDYITGLKGSVIATSIWGQGTKFTVHLPILAAPAG